MVGDAFTPSRQDHLVPFHPGSGEGKLAVPILWMMHVYNNTLVAAEQDRSQLPRHVMVYADSTKSSLP